MVKSVIFACLLAIALIQTHAFLGFTKKRSWLYYEPPIDGNQERLNDVSEHYIIQKLDNFDAQNQHTFRMRYMKNERYFKSGGPIFIFVGGEWTISPGAILPGQHIHDMAKEFNGLLFYTEHRYYGRTRPTDSVSTENLRYLSIDQSLADLAHFITEIKSDKKLNATGGVLLVGGSYSGTMVAWFRQKYPHLVNGAWASSAPLNAKLDFFEYKEAVGVSILSVGGENCYYKLEEIFQANEDLITNGEFKHLKELYNICDNFDETNQYDLWNFHSTLSDILSGIVQNDRSGRIKNLCQWILIENFNASTSIESDELYQFALLVRRYLEDPKEKCVQFSYQDTLNVVLEEEWSSLAADQSYRQWMFQTCSELGWYQTSTSDDQPFGSNFPIEFYLKICNDLFGDAFTNSTLHTYINRKNTIYGSFNPEVTNVFFTNGKLDPWHRMGIIKDLNAHSPSAFIPGASHCNDLQSINFGRDSKEMLYAKLTIRNLFKSWLRL